MSESKPEFSLNRVILEKLHVERNPLFKLAADQQVSFHLNITIEHRIVEAKIIHSFFSLRLNQDKELDNEPFAMEFTLVGCFELPGAATEECVAEIGGQLAEALYPYTKEMLDNITSRMGYPPIPLPALRGVQPANAKEGGKSSL